MRQVAAKAVPMVIALAMTAAAILSLVAGRRAAKGPAFATSTSPAPADGRTTIGLPVRAVPAVRGDLIIRLTAPGEVIARKRATIKSEAGGAIVRLPAEEGKAVRAGEVLAAVDDRACVLRLGTAEAERLKRLSELLVEREFAISDQPEDKGIEGLIQGSAAALDAVASAHAAGRVGTIELDRARKAHESLLIEAGRKKEEVRAASSGLTQAEIRVAEAGLDLERTRVRAPFAGVLTAITVSTGETVVPGQGLMTLIDIRDVTVQARVLESEAGRMRLGRNVDLRFAAHPNRVFKGRIRALSPVIDPADRTSAVHIDVEDPGGEIKPGMHAEAAIEVEVHPGCLLVPQEAVLFRDGRKLVFVVEGGSAQWRYVATGLENDLWIEILDGIREGEPVIVEGHLNLAHGAKVRIE